MNKTTKGALGASAAAVLLMGGAGSLAYWTDLDTVPGGSITAGSLSIDPKVANAPCEADWKYAGTTAKTGTVVQGVVPGDVVSKTCTFVVTATGDNLKASLSTPAVTVGYGTTSSSFKVTPKTEYTLDGGAVLPTTSGTTTEIKSVNNGKELKVVVTLDIPFGAPGSALTGDNRNDSQLKTATISPVDIVLTQLNPNPVA
ncbi:MAG: hypothetical protein JWN84_3048 [Nocardioides sp.]|nr:hypothetical protein [Nocardioides sp.]